MALLARSLDTRADAAGDHGRRGNEHDEGQPEVQAAVSGEVRKKRTDGVRAVGEGAASGKPDVGDRPARDHRIEGEDARTGEDAQGADHPPGGAGLDGVERPHRILLCTPAHGELGDHDRKADENDARQIQQHEHGAAALADLGWEPPDVA